MKISTKILNRSISRQKDRSFNRSLLDYMRQRKKAKEKIFNTCRKSPRNHGSRFPSLHAPQKHPPRQRVQAQPGYVFNPIAAPVISFVPSGETVKFQSKKKLRPIVIDGQNVAVAHGMELYRGFDFRKRFSSRGIRIVVDYFAKRFTDRGEKKTEVVVWLPETLKAEKLRDFRDNKVILEELEREGHIQWTEVKKMYSGEIIPTYDDRKIVEHAAECGGIIVSNDKFRDLVHEEGGKFREAIEKRRLTFNFVNDCFLPTRDNNGRKGPLLDKFLEF